MQKVSGVRSPPGADADKRIIQNKLIVYLNHARCDEKRNRCLNKFVKPAED